MIKSISMFNKADVVAVIELNNVQKNSHYDFVSFHILRCSSPGTFACDVTLQIKALYYMREENRTPCMTQCVTSCITCNLMLHFTRMLLERVHLQTQFVR